MATERWWSPERAFEADSDNEEVCVNRGWIDVRRIELKHTHSARELAQERTRDQENGGGGTAGDSALKEGL